MSAASLDQAAACLRHFFNQQVAEAMPAAIRHQLADARALSAWLADQTLRIDACLFGALDAADLPMLDSLSTSSLLAMLFDQQQPGTVTVAVRNVLLGRYLSDEAVQAAAILQANRKAREAVQDLQAQQQARAERQALHGTAVPGVNTAARTLDASEC